MDGIKWGEDLERDCAELKKLESWGIYPSGYHDQNCSLLRGSKCIKLS